MKKKVLMLGAGLTLGSALLVTSAFADIGGAKGYEAYKDALKQTAAASSATQRIALALQDNGRSLLNVTTTVKENGKDVSGKAAIQSGGTSQTFEFYNQDGQSVLKAGNSDTYFVTNESGKREMKHADRFKDNPQLSKEMENVVDALVGNLKNEVILSGSEDGQHSIDVKLTGSRIPSAANVIGSLLIKEMSGKDLQNDMAHRPMGSQALGLDAAQITSEFPKLTQDVNIDEISLHADIDGDQHIRSQTIGFKVSGKDASGQSHNVAIRADINTSDLGTTTPDSVNLTGKKVQKIESADFEH